MATFEFTLGPRGTVEAETESDALLTVVQQTGQMPSSLTEIIEVEVLEG